MTELSYTHINSPVGSLMVAGDDDALHYLCFPKSPKAIDAAKARFGFHRDR
jgi:hypothetical protein